MKIQYSKCPSNSQSLDLLKQPLTVLRRRGAPTSGRLARRSLAAGWELLRRRRGRAVDPPPTPGREPRRFAGAAPGLAPCRPLIGAPGRPLGREARRPSAALGAHGRREMKASLKSVPSNGLGEIVGHSLCPAGFPDHQDVHFYHLLQYGSPGVKQIVVLNAAVFPICEL
ncbi:uncharacterized protein LOC144613817 [Panthera onca]